MKTKSYILPFILCVIVGGLVGKKVQPLVISYYATDSTDYCDFNGIYYSPSSGMYDPILADKYTFNGMLYAYVCNINQINTQIFDLFPNANTYGVVRGNINHIPISILKGKSLEYLQIHDQKLSVLPPEIGSFTYLNTLKLPGNELTHLPETIGNLSNLEHFELQANRLKSLPSSIIKLKKLRILDLRQNPQLTKLPEGMKNLENLQYLYLGGTNISQEESDQLQEDLPNTQIYK